MSIKNKTLLFVTLVLIAFSVVLIGVLKMQQKQELSLLYSKEKKEIASIYKEINENYQALYDNKFVFNLISFDIKEAIKNRERETLYKLVEEKLRVLQEKNTNITAINFYLPDNTLLLKTRQPNDIYNYENRALIKKVHKTKSTIVGFDNDKDGLAYKINQPIFYSQEYIGVLEVSLDINYLLQDMKKYANLEGGIFVEDKLKYFTIKDESIFQYKVNDGVITTNKKKSYFSYLFEIKNTNNVTLAELYIFKDMTFTLNQMQKDIDNIVIYLISMIVIVLILMHFGLNKILVTIQTSYDDLIENQDMIDENVMIVDTSEDGTILGVSHRFCSVSGYAQKELLSHSLKILKDDVIPEKFYKHMYETLKVNGNWDGELKLKTKEGKTYWLETKIQAKSQDDKFICFNHIMHDITDKKINQELLLTDELTNLYNRRYFNDIFPRAAHSIQRNGGCFNFVVLDVDDFKNYNDIYGSSMGDEALIKIAEVLTNSFRRGDDYCFRLGGAEFGVVFKSTNKDEGYLYTQVLRKNIEMIKIKHEGNLTYKVLTASLGLVSEISDNIEDEKKLYKLAYEHLYRAKENGRNKVVRELL